MSLAAVPPHQEAQGLPDGISMEMLGSQEITVQWGPSEAAMLLLERIPLDPGDTLDGRDPDESGGGRSAYTNSAQSWGAHVLYVETGEVVVAELDSEVRYPAGKSAFVPAPPLEVGRSLPDPTYDLRNETEDCASVLRFSVFFPPAAFGGVPTAPSGPERGCGAYELLFFDAPTFPWRQPPPEEIRVQMFLARLGWTEDTMLASWPIAYSGPVGYMVESGTFSVFAGSNSGEVRAEIRRSGQVGLNAGVTFSAWGRAGTHSLVLGAVPADEKWVVVPPPPETDANSTSAPFPPGAVVMTSDERVRMRAGPTIKSAIVIELPRGSELTIAGPPERGPGDDFDWYPVVDRDGRTGYVAGPFLALPQA
jgi:hypothetical protein